MPNINGNHCESNFVCSQHMLPHIFVLLYFTRWPVKKDFWSRKTPEKLFWLSVINELFGVEQCVGHSRPGLFISQQRIFIDVFRAGKFTGGVRPSLQFFLVWLASQGTVEHRPYPRSNRHLTRPYQRIKKRNQDVQFNTSIPWVHVF